MRVGDRLLPLVAERRRTAKAIKLRADAVQGVLHLTLPARGGLAEALALIERNHTWLVAQVAAWPAPRPLLPGARIPFDGNTLLIDWTASHPRTPRRSGDRLLVGGPADLVPARVLRWLQGAARADLTAATTALAAGLGHAAVAIRIGDARARWGSCARGRPGSVARIAYSWRLIMAPPPVRRHIVAHEVAHLVHANHSADFYALLATLDPHRDATRRWLEAHGTALHWVGRD